jgi:tetratricopeptide (TPR) repeat protein
MQGQRLGPAPKRPKASTIVDTNDALGYFRYGTDIFDNDPKTAAAAFYWAARIDPNNAEALYARRAALVMADEGMMRQYMEGGRRAHNSKEMRALDSLQYRALKINPFVYRRLDKRMFMTYLRKSNERSSPATGRATSSEFQYVMESYLRTAGPGTRAWIAYTEGDFPEALSLYAQAMKSTKEKADLRIERARIFAMRAQQDSAIAEFRLALEELRKKDAKDLVVFYDSKAVMEHSVGVLLEQTDDFAGAKEAYGRALQEDLSYYPAHMRLGLLALNDKDTTTAISELELATQIAADEPVVRFTHGYTLAAAGRNAEALEQIKKAIEIEPYYARPYIVLGQVHEALKDGPSALAAYNDFMARATQSDGQRKWVQNRIDLLKELTAKP